MADHPPYVRVYLRLQDEYRDLYDDPTALGTWLQLLVIAEGAYPAEPHLPRKIRQKPLKLLTDAGLIVLTPGQRFTVKGLAAERARRSEQGRKGGLASGERRTSAPRPFNERSTNVEPRRDETRLDKTSIAGASADEKPWVLLTDDEKADALQAERDEMIAKAMRQVGLRPTLVKP